MRLGKELKSLTKSELERAKEALNLTDSEEVVFDMLAKDKSIVYIADKSGMSTSTVSNRVKDIREKYVRWKYE